MPTINYDARSILIAGRRVAIAGAGLEYAALDPSVRADRLRALASLGFNVVESSCPWMLHEPVPGLVGFEGRLDLNAFLEEAGSAGLRTILRIGPAVGAPWDGGGLPPWLTEVAGLEARSGTPAFMERVASWFATLAERIVDHQANRAGGGPLIAIQIEHSWRCGDTSSADAYLRELLRFVRERGLTVPVLTSNGFWSPVEGAIERWSGWDDLFSNVRQLVGIQPNAPRLCSIDRGDGPDAFRRPGRRHAECTPEDLVGRMARVVAAGGQPIVSHAVAGSLPAGAAGIDDAGPIAADAIASPLIDAAGRATDRGFAVGRMARFLRDFGPLVADLDPEDTPLVADPDDPDAEAMIVPRSGGLGDLVVVFRGRSDTLVVVDREGRRIPVDFAGRSVAWRVFDADLDGRGRLDFATASPLAFVDGRLLLLAAPAGSTVELSIDGRPVEVKVPAARGSRSKPEVIEHAGFTVAVVSEEASEHVFDVSGGLVIGAVRQDAEGCVDPADGSKAWRIDVDGTVTSPETITPSAGRRRRPKTWAAWHEPDPFDPAHPRSIPFDGALGLASMAAGLDHAWISANVTLRDGKSRTLRFLGGLGDAQAWLDGKPLDPVRDGTLELKGSRGDHRLGLFVRHRRRHVDAMPAPSDADRPGALVAVKPLAGVKRRSVESPPVDPTSLSAFIPDGADGERTTDVGLGLSFTHRRKSTILLEVAPGSAGVVVVNDVPWATFGRSGARFELSAGSVEPFKAGANRIVLLPLEHVAESGVEPSVTLLEVVEELVPADGWRVRRWESAPDPRIGGWRSPATRTSPMPRWIRGEVPFRKVPEAAVLELDGLVRGRVQVNGVDLGGYDLREPGARAGGHSPLAMWIPESILSLGDRIVVDIFDEAGADPAKVAVRF